MEGSENGAVPPLPPTMKPGLLTRNACNKYHKCKIQFEINQRPTLLDRIIRTYPTRLESTQKNPADYVGTPDRAQKMVPNNILGHHHGGMARNSPEKVTLRWMHTWWSSA